MLYFPKQKAKLYLISLCGLLCLHTIFVSTKGYTAYFKVGVCQINNASEEQYQSCLSSLNSITVKTEYINNTRIKYLYVLPEQSILLIYLGYLLIIIKLIVSAKFNLNEEIDEN